MKKLLSLLLVLALIHCCALAEIEYITNVVVSARPLDGSTPEPTATSVPTEAPTSVPTLVPMPEPTATPTPEPTASSTPAPTATPTPEPTATPTPEPTNAPTPEPTPRAYDGEYEIEVDIASQIVTVYRAGSRSGGSIARQMICSSGADHSTPLGTFVMPEIQKEDEREEWYYIARYELYVQYATRIVDDILFHSLPSAQKNVSPTEDSLEGLGMPVSHGCIRLRPADARWIAENCPPGTQVHIYDDGEVEETLRALLMKSSFSADAMGYVEFLNGKMLYSISSELPQVATLQDRLNELGYAIEETDGCFGAQTHASVVKWQLRNGYAANGEMTEAQLNALIAPQPTETPVPTANPTASASSGKQSGRVQVDTALILRSAPSSQSQKLDSLPNGTQVSILEETRGWYKVEVNGKTGYVGRNYIRFE